MNPVLQTSMSAGCTGPAASPAPTPTGHTPAPVWRDTSPSPTTAPARLRTVGAAPRRDPSVTPGGGLDPLCHTRRGSGPSVTPGRGLDPLCHTGRGSGPSLSHKEGVWTPSVTQGGGLDQEGVWTRRGSGPLCHTSRGSGPGGGLDPSVTPGGGLDPLCHTGRGLDPILVQTPPSLTEGFQTRGSGPGGGLAQEGVWPSPPSST